MTLCCILQELKTNRIYSLKYLEDNKEKYSLDLKIQKIGFLQQAQELTDK